MKDYTGIRKGRLVAVKYVRKDKHGHSVWLFQCDCGNQVEYDVQVIRPRNTTVSCGCVNNEVRKSGNNRRTHGAYGTRLYRIWGAMKARCYCPSSLSNPRNKGYKNITVCEEWRNDFRNFQAWAMSNGYADDLSIDRIDNAIGYCPENCRWVTTKQQANNKRNNHKVIIDGKEYSIKDACAKFCISTALYYKRVKNGYSEIDALTTPKKRDKYETAS